MTATPKENRHSSNKHEALENSCSVPPSTWTAATIGNVVVKTKQRDPRNSPNEVFQYVDVSSVSNESFSITGSSPVLGSDAPSRARKAIAKNDRDGRPRPSHLTAGWRCEWKELDSLKSKRLAIRFLRDLSGRKASHGAARPPRPTISGNPACSTLRRFRGQTLSSDLCGLCALCGIPYLNSEG